MKLTPVSERTRRESERRADLAAAHQEGMDGDDVSRAARSMAVRLRLRQIGRDLLGTRGLGRAVLGWAVLLLVLIAAALVANIVLVFAVLVLAVTVVALVQAGIPSRWSHRLMVASAVLGVISFAYVWWVLGVGIDAADEGVPEPPLAAWSGVGLIGVLVAVIGFITSAVLALIHEQSRREHAD